MQFMIVAGMSKACLAISSVMWYEWSIIASANSITFYNTDGIPAMATAGLVYAPPLSYHR